MSLKRMYLLFLILLICIHVYGDVISQITLYSPVKGVVNDSQKLPSLKEIETWLQSKGLTIDSPVNIQINNMELTELDLIIDSLIVTYSTNNERIKISKDSNFYTNDMINEINNQNNQVLKLIDDIKNHYFELYKNSLKKMQFSTNVRCSKESTLCKNDQARSIEDLEAEGLAKCDPLWNVLNKFGVDTRNINKKSKCPNRNYDNDQGINSNGKDSLPDNIEKIFDFKCPRKLLGDFKNSIESDKARYNIFVLHDDSSLDTKSTCRTLRMAYIFNEKTKSRKLIDAYYLDDENKVTLISQDKFDLFLKEAKISQENTLSTSINTKTTTPSIIRNKAK